jgi:hypothetical protein
MTEDAAKIVVSASFELSLVSIKIFDIGYAAFNANEVTDAMRGKLEDAMQKAGDISRKIADAARS